MELQAGALPRSPGPHVQWLAGSSITLTDLIAILTRQGVLQVQDIVTARGVCRHPQAASRRHLAAAAMDGVRLAVREATDVGPVDVMQWQ